MKVKNTVTLTSYLLLLLSICRVWAQVPDTTKLVTRVPADEPSSKLLAQIQQTASSTQTGKLTKTRTKEKRLD